METPTYILTEIEEISKQIKDIEIQLNGTIPPTSSATMASSSHVEVPETTQIDIVLKGEFNTLTKEIQQKIIRILATLTDIEPDQITIVKVIKGSIIFRIEMPKEAAKRLLDINQTQNPILQDIDIIEIREIREILNPTQRNILYKELKHLQRLHQAHNERLQHLMLQRAKMGLHTSESISAEIDETSQKIDEMYLLKKAGCYDADAHDAPKLRSSARSAIRSASGGIAPAPRMRSWM